MGLTDFLEINTNKEVLIHTKFDKKKEGTMIMRKTYTPNAIIIGIIMGIAIALKINVVSGIIAGLIISIVGWVLIQTLEKVLYGVGDAADDAIKKKIKEMKDDK